MVGALGLRPGSERGSAVADIICPVCCEPWDVSEVSQYVAEFREMFPRLADTVSVRSVFQAFTAEGCGVAFSAWGFGFCEAQTSETGDLVREAAALLGDDLDGLASFCGDLGVAS
jgi:hypothetical protein